MCGDVRRHCDRLHRLAAVPQRPSAVPLRGVALMRGDGELVLVGSLIGGCTVLVAGAIGVGIFQAGQDSADPACRPTEVVIDVIGQQTNDLTEDDELPGGQYCVDVEVLVDAWDGEPR